MTEEQRALMWRVNAEVNALPFDEHEGHGEPPDWWTDQPMAGRSFVCRDYVEMKATRLREPEGLFPPEALTIRLCWVETGEYHAVLGIADGSDVWILDNRVEQPYLKASPPLAYKWERRQVPGTRFFEPDEGAG